MIRHPPASTRTDTLFPSPTLFRSAEQLLGECLGRLMADEARERIQLRPLRRQRLGLLVVRHLQAMLDPTEIPIGRDHLFGRPFLDRSEEHTSELQSLMRISYAVFCLNKKKRQT